jgi:uncharacterized protein (TIGR02099 family)
MSSGKPSPSRTGLRARLRSGVRAARHALSGLRAALRRLRNRLPPPVKRLIRRATRVSLHSLNGVLITIVILFGLAWLWLPTLAGKKPEIEMLLSSTLGSPVQIGQLDTFWDGLNPGVRAQEFRAGAAEGAAALRLRELRLSLAWGPLLTGRIVINQLVIVEPHLVVEHLPDGRFRLTGIEVAPGSAEGAQDLGDWLLRQREMAIENGTLEWIDRHPAGAPEERLTIRRVNAVLRKDGDRRRFDLRAQFPETLCADCRVSADLTGNPLRSSDWSGELNLEARALNMEAVPRLLRARLPAGLAGRISARLESRWRDGWPESVSGQLTVRDLSLPWPGQDQPVALRSLDTLLQWRGDREQGRLDLARLALGLARAPWQTGRVQLAYAPDRQSLKVEHVDVGALSGFLAGLELDGAAMDWLRTARPDGSVDRLLLTREGPLTQPPRDYQLNADLRGLRFAAHQRLPGASALSGHLQAGPRGGEFRLDSGPNRIQLPRVFREPLDVQRVESRVTWRQEAEHWLVRAAAIEAQSRDGRVRGDVELRVPRDAALSPVIKLDFKVSDGVVANAARYFPLILPEALRDYLGQALVGGRLTAGSVHLHGALRNFPFRDGKGSFEVRAHVSGGVLSYLPGWEPVRQIEADMRFTGIGMQITASSGQLRTLQAGRVVVTIDDFRAPEGAVVAAMARLHGPMADVLAVLADSKSPRFAPYLVNGLQTAGNGTLTLDLRIPARNPAASAIAGEYQFLGGSLEFPFRGVRAADLRGRLDFTESGLQHGEVTAQLLGGDTILTATPAAGAGGGTRLDLRGAVSQPGLDQLFGKALAASLRGEVPWKAWLLLRRDRPDGALEADLSQLEISLPAPLAKVRGKPLPLVLRTLPTTASGQTLLDLQMEGRVTGRLALRTVAGEWQFDRGRIGVGERISQLPEAAGLHLSARLPSLNADRWWQQLRQNIRDTGTTGWFDYVNRLSAEVEALEIFDRPFGQVSVDVAKRGSQWRGQLQGEAAAGQVVFLPSGCQTAAECPPRTSGEAVVPDPRPAVHMTFDQLTWPAARQGAKPEATDPRNLPVFTLKADAFSAMGRAFGVLTLDAEPVRQGWQINQLTLSTPETRLTAKGSWDIDWQGEQSSHFTVSVTSKNLGTTLAQLGYPDELVGGRLKLNSRWNWRGAPANLSLAGIAGDLSLELDEGRLPTISPGASRLLGVLDLRSLTRYLSLDLSSVFGKGTTFDRIRGKLEIERGHAYTRGLEVRAPGADLEMSGRIGFLQRDLDLEMKVTPHLMEELAITGGLIGGPAVGAAVALLHNLAKKPFEKQTRVSYTVKGSWDQPDVKRVSGPELPLPAGEQQ